jgi:hypothetical protein
MTETAAKIILEDAHEIICDAKEAKNIFRNLSRVMIALIFTAVSTVSVLIYMVNNQRDDFRFLNKDYCPLWVVTEMEQSHNLEAKEIAATFSATDKDKEKLNEILQKYSDFQKFVLNQLATIRGGSSNITRSYHPLESVKGGSQ